MLLAQSTETVWYQWLAVALAVPAVLLVIVTVILYVRKVVMPRYPRR
ncbi:MAG: hypothetical protein HYX32_10815 [Actinobacteria bacterium]|nr:hypothetical protein [Actinomycetota bacterium]